MTDEKRSWLRTVIMSVTIGFLSGVGLMAMTVTGDVREHAVLISRQSKDFEIERSRTDARVFELAGMIKESSALSRSTIDLTTKLIATIEIQNRLIIDQNSTIQQLRNK